ncbi:MAG: sensor histidine kinase N-terminal domain-containing protein [Pseudomonadota bacterium]|nr:sensor histidine kinase N-terminal domain-containing protein [Pseudomonadota bacterium]
MKNISLRLRLTLLLALATLIALGLAAWVVDWRADSEMQQRFDAALLARAQALTALVRIEDNQIEVDTNADQGSVFPGDIRASRYELRCNGATVARTAQAPPSVPVHAFPQFTNDVVGDDNVLRVVAMRFSPLSGDSSESGSRANKNRQSTTCDLRYAMDRGSLDDILDTLDLILLGSIFGACALVLALTPWLVQRGLRPLAVLDAAMAGIGPEAPSRRLPRTDTPELTPLVARFNEVLVRMDEGLSRERQFAAGLAHELRTRLAELRTLVDVEIRYPSGDDPRAPLREIGKIGGELEATVTALLQLTRIESGLQSAQRERVDLEALLARVLARHADAAQTRNARIECIAPSAPVEIDTDPTLLEIILDNLLGNAIAYAPMGDTISLHCANDTLRVDNAAPGLDAGDIARFGQRFWRKGADENGAGHAGLGLALADAAARALDMRLHFTLESGRLRATLSWSNM